jgi:hypothetical protein
VLSFKKPDLAAATAPRGLRTEALGVHRSGGRRCLASGGSRTVQDMKKTKQKLLLHKETLTGLDSVRGGNNSHPPICTAVIPCSGGACPPP